MKKFILLFSFIYIFNTGCSQDNFGNEIGKESTSTISNVQQKGLVSFNIDKTEYKNNESLTFTIRNNSESSISYGYDIQLEEEVGGQWVRVSLDNISPVLMELHLAPNSDYSEEFLGISYLDNGKYRIVKRVTIEEDGTEVHLISDVFEVIRD